MMSSEIDARFIKKRIEDTRCPEQIKAAGVKAGYVYMLRERIECGDWQHVAEYFIAVKGKYILTEPIAARRYFTVDPEKVIAVMNSKGLW